MGNNLDFPLALLANHHRITQVPHTIIDFDLIVQELFKRPYIENLVRGGL